MDLSEAATAVTEIPPENLEQFAPAGGEGAAVAQCTICPDRDVDPVTDEGLPATVLHGGAAAESEVEWKQLEEPPKAAAGSAADVAQPRMADDFLSGEASLAALSFASQKSPLTSNVQCQEEPSQLPEQDPTTAASPPLVPEKTEATPLTPVTTDDSLSSDDATGDLSQSSNPEWIKCQSSPRRLSSASADSSTATISPSDTLAGASTTDESLSSDETALDLSQTSFESTKYQSDLESVSVSSIVRKTTACTPSDYTDDPSQRRVSFPMKDSDLVTGYMEPANPWESANSVTTTTELINLYKASCLKHNTVPLEEVVRHLGTLDFGKTERCERLDLRGTPLRPEACEALEEILKRVQYHTIDLTRCNLNENAASAIFDMIEFYESAVELDMSENPPFSSAGWQSCISMMRKSRDLRVITLRGNPVSEMQATNLGKAINMSNLHTLKLEHCGLTGRPLASLCNTLRNNKTLRELWLANNDLYCRDADKIADLLKANPHIQFLDISNNNLKDTGMKSIAAALMEQAKNINEEKLKGIDPNKTQRQGSQERDESVSWRNNIVESSTNGSRSMLDALLQMQPDECKEPVQTITPISNNNIRKENKVELTIGSNKIPETEVKSDIKTEKLESISEHIKSSHEDIEIMVSFADTDEMAAQKDDQKLTTNNNTVKDEIADTTLSDESQKRIKTYDLNENKGNADNESLLINILGDTNIKETCSSRSPMSSSPMLFSRPSSVEELERRFKEDAAAYTTRSQSCDSLSSDNSLDAMETHLSAEIKEKITKNDTLGRQQKMNQNNENLVDNNLKPPRGLQALILWNNNLTRTSGEYVADMIESTNSLEILNIGKNTLSNEFIQKISNSLKYNTTLTSLGLQSSHLSSVGIKTLADVLSFGGNNKLERIDIRDNNVQVDGLMALCDALKSNKCITQIDIDDEPKRFQDDGDGQFHYSKYLNTVRGLFARNQLSHGVPKIRSSRKISLTCQSIHTPTVKNILQGETLDPRKKTRLRSPLPSPQTGSPSSSPIPSPSRGNRFQVSRVSENNKITPTLSPRLDSKPNEPLRSSPSPTSRFRVTIVQGDDFNKKVRTGSTGPPPSLLNAKSLDEKPAPVKSGTNNLQFVFPDIAKMKSSNVDEGTQTDLDKALIVEDPNPLLIKEPVKTINEKSPDSSIQPPHKIEIEHISDAPIEKATEPVIPKPTNSFTDKPIELALDKPKQSVNNQNKEPIVEKAREPVIGKPQECAAFDASTSSAPANVHIVPAPPVDASDIPIFVGTETIPSEAKSKSVKTIRKSSWNTNPTVEKLFTFFQNGAAYFNRSNSNESDNKASESSDSLNSLVDGRTRHSGSSDGKGQTTLIPTAPDVQVREQITSKTQSLLEAASKQFKEIKTVLKQNITPTQSIQQLPSTPLPLSETPNTATEESPSVIIIADATSMHPVQESSERSAADIDIEIKENISPLQQHPMNSPPCVHSNEVANSDKILKLENSSQVAVDLGDKLNSSDMSMATQSQTAQLGTMQGNESTISK